MKAEDHILGPRSGIIARARGLAGALLIVVFFRSFLFQPFYIPSGSMEPTMLVGDYVFVSKFSYGYSRYSLPLSLDLFSGRIFPARPQRGDLVVFRLPRDDTVDYIKRVIGLPGDRIQVVGGVLSINGEAVKRERISDYVGPNPCGPSETDNRFASVAQWRETLPNGVAYTTLQCASFRGFPDYTDVYVVPAGHYFMMGDNREDSEDSRFPDVGFVPFHNLIGKAQMVFFSLQPGRAAWEVWRWPSSVRWGRLFENVV